MDGVVLTVYCTVLYYTVLYCTVLQVLDEVQCPQLVLTAGSDHQNEKPGGLASKVWGWVAL